MPADTKFPEIEVKLTGTDGNAFAIMGRVVRAMKRHGCDPAAIDAYTEAAMSGSYDHLLQVTMKTVNVT